MHRALAAPGLGRDVRSRLARMTRVAVSLVVATATISTASTGIKAHAEPLAGVPPASIDGGHSVSTHREACTTGFGAVGRAKDGAPLPFIVTARHCFAFDGEADGAMPDRLVLYSMYNQNSPVVVSTPSGRCWRRATHCRQTHGGKMRLDVIALATVPEAAPTYLLTFDGTSDAVEVVGAVEPGGPGDREGDVLCAYGAKTRKQGDEQCGRISPLGKNDEKVPGAMKLHLPECVVGGDSGGPVFRRLDARRVQLAGIMIAGCEDPDDPPDDPVGVYLRVHPILDKLGLEVMTRQSPGAGHGVRGAFLGPFADWTNPSGPWSFASVPAGKTAASSSYAAFTEIDTLPYDVDTAPQDPKKDCNRGMHRMWRHSADEFPFVGRAVSFVHGSDDWCLVPVAGEVLAHPSETDAVSIRLDTRGLPGDELSLVLRDVDWNCGDGIEYWIYDEDSAGDLALVRSGAVPNGEAVGVPNLVPSGPAVRIVIGPVADHRCDTTAVDIVHRESQP